MTRHYTKRDVLERFMSKVDITDDCWRWTAGINSAGYGTFNPAYGTKKYAHRWLYETVVEPVPAELQLDHLCFNRRCVNPDHLEPVTPQENTRRALWTTECKNGHPRTEENVYLRPDNGQRQCRACTRERWREKNPGRSQRKHKSTDLQQGCPGDPASNANKDTSNQFQGLLIESATKEK